MFLYGVLCTNELPKQERRGSGTGVPSSVRPWRRARAPCPSALRCAVSLICRAALMPVQLISPPPPAYSCTYVMTCGGGCPYIFALLCKIIVLYKSVIRLLCSFAGAAPSGPAAGKIARQKRGPTGVRPRSNPLRLSAVAVPRHSARLSRAMSSSQTASMSATMP